MTDRDDHITLEGTVLETARDVFKIQINNTETIITAKVSGRLRLNKIRILIGDRVVVNVSKYDTSKGIIKTRL